MRRTLRRPAPPAGRFAACAQPIRFCKSARTPTPLEADVPCSGLRKGGLLHKHSRQHATKTQCWSSCKDPPFPNPTCLPTCIYFSYIYCIHHLPTSPTSYSTAHATTCPPPLLLTPGVHHTPRWPRPRRPAPAPPCPAVKEPDNGHRDPDRRPLRLPQTPKSSLTRSAFGLRRPEPLPSRSITSRTLRSLLLHAIHAIRHRLHHDCLPPHRPHDHRLRFPRVCSTRYTPRAQSRPAPASRLPSRPHMPTHIRPG